MALHTATFGELYQTSLDALEKLCNHQKFLQKLQERSKLLGTCCDRPELSIKCSQKKCGCNSYSPSYQQKRRFSKQRRFLDFLVVVIRNGASLKIRRTKESENDKTSKDNMLAMRFQYESSDDSSEDGFEDVQNKFDVLDLRPMEPYQEKVADATPPSPNAKIYIFLDKYYDKPIPVIAYFDTGASCTIMQQEILPVEYWEECSIEFRIANGQPFIVSLINWGPIENLPYHPQYPFIATFELNDEFLDRFPKDAYIMLWYLAEICTIKVQVHGNALLRYVSRCLLTEQDREFKVFYQWLTFFQDATWWQKNICKTMSMLSITVTFRIKTTIIQEDSNIKVQKKFEAKMALEVRICAIIHRDRPGPGILAQVMEASKKAKADAAAPPFDFRLFL
ncbi:hypothetical protein LIER_08000 [Lithospermum erythrorhizon]|uniref:Uncharacterized protein n=1 Tax=Lithospermum erythrorhizon TaxID=34254 RepID=A0AAV3PEM5_LITER